MFPVRSYAADAAGTGAECRGSADRLVQTGVSQSVRIDEGPHCAPHSREGDAKGSVIGLVQAGCEAIPVAAIPACGEGFRSNLECCSLTYSGEVPGVVEGCSQIYADWRASKGAKKLRELPIDDGLCLELTRTLWRRGFPVGPSSGLNLAAAEETARDLGSGAVVVTVFPDRMERYFSHAVFASLREELVQKPGNMS